MDNINWEDIYIQLYAYADQLLKYYAWFRGENTNSYLKGQQAHDYAAEAIEKYLREPEKYNPSTGRSLLNYLKWHLIRSSIGDDLRSAENLTSSDLLSHSASEKDAEDAFDNSEAFLPFIAANFDEDIDYRKIMKEIEDALQNDPLAKLIFEEVRCSGYNRRDLIKDHQLNEHDYDNAMKRLKTVLRKVAKQYHYE